MKLRRLGALVAPLMLFQLAVAGGELACTRRGVDQRSAVQHGDVKPAHQHGHDAHTGDSSPADNQPSNHGPGHHATMPPCCQAMTACSNAIPMLSSNANFLEAPDHAGRLVLAMSLLVSRVEAPDPPPPKA